MQEEQEIKTISVKEFRELGFIQEINRILLHPRGLALSVNLEDDGSESLGDIWDYRDDPEGLVYDLKNSDSERIEKFRKNRDSVNALYFALLKTRYEKFRFAIEPIPRGSKLCKACLDWKDSFSLNCKHCNKEEKKNMENSELLNLELTEKYLKNLDAIVRSRGGSRESVLIDIIQKELEEE